MMTHPGVYCLRSNVLDWDADTMWRTSITLTDAEAVFRALISELGLRPIFHHKQHRADGHLFISVLAYQAVQVLRTSMKKARYHDNWTSLRRILGNLQRNHFQTQRQQDPARSQDRDLRPCRQQAQPAAQWPPGCACSATWILGMLKIG